MVSIPYKFTTVLICSDRKRIIFSRGNTFFPLPIVQRSSGGAHSDEVACYLSFLASGLNLRNQPRIGPTSTMAASICDTSLGGGLDLRGDSGLADTIFGSGLDLYGNGTSMARSVAHPWRRPRALDLQGQRCLQC